MQNDGASCGEMIFFRKGKRILKAASQQQGGIQLKALTRGNLQQLEKILLVVGLARIVTMKISSPEIIKRRYSLCNGGRSADRFLFQNRKAAATKSFLKGKDSNRRLETPLCN